MYEKTVVFVQIVHLLKKYRVNHCTTEGIMITYTYYIIIASRNYKKFEGIEMDYPNDLIGGEIVPPLVIRDKYVIRDEHKGTVYVKAGQLKLEGILSGTLHVKGESKVEIPGTQVGPIYISKGSVVTVSGAIEGTTNLEQGSKLIVEEGGRVEGSLFNQGCVVLRGVFGGGVNGGGEIKVEGKGQIKKPVFRDGLIFFI